MNLSCGQRVGDLGQAGAGLGHSESPAFFLWLLMEREGSREAEWITQSFSADLLSL